MNNLNNIFKKIAEIEPSKNLEERILKEISLRNELAIRRKLSFIYAGFLVSVGIFIWTVTYLGKVVYHSSFWDLALLMFSDTGLIIKNWGSFTYSLLETLPIFGLIVAFLPIFAIFLLASAYFKTISNNRYRFI